jgi:hypothetical protein
MTDFVPSESGTPIRYPSTANLMVDSTDRVNPTITTPWNFSINKNMSIMNGFFTRIATTEVVLNWNIPNSLYLGTVTVVRGGVTKTIIMSAISAFQNAEEALRYLVQQLNLAGNFGAGIFTVALVSGEVYVSTSDTSNFTIAGAGAVQLGFSLIEGAQNQPAHQVINPDLRPYPYFDFVSSQLTYNQSVKDATTSPANTNVLCRWYFAWDNSPTFDNLGFPILMGYAPFVCRRLFNPPKQIKWSPNQPLGQLQFQIVDKTGTIIAAPPSTSGFTDAIGGNWQMTLQVSEV